MIAQSISLRFFATLRMTSYLDAVILTLNVVKGKDLLFPECRELPPVPKPSG